MIVAALLAVAYVLLSATSKPEARGQFTQFAKGGIARLEELPAPPPQTARAFTDAAGTETNLAAFRGEVVVVNVWATSCAPCMEEMPTLGALQRQFAGRGLRVVPISIDKVSDYDQAKRELARLTQNTLPFYTDASRGVLFDSHAAGLPVTILYDRQGRERARLTGGADWASPEAAALMEALLGEG